MDKALYDALTERGVIVHAPDATVIRDVGPEAFEAGVEIFAAVTIRGAHSRFGAGTTLGRAGGGYFENVATGRNTHIYGGYLKDCVLLDGVTLRGHAEVRGGTILEEGCEGAHHVGYKMTILMPWVIAGSMVNLCDVLMAGGYSRARHGEIGSSLALYNFTPWGDKHASLFGDVPLGVFLREKPIFIGGGTQIVSPVHIGFGAVIPAGCAVRRDVKAGHIYGEVAQGIDRPFVFEERGIMGPRIHAGLRYLGNIVALQNWYRYARIPAAAGDDHLCAVYAHAERQLTAQVDERIKRIRRMLDAVEPSLEAHRHALANKSNSLSFKQRFARIDDHEAVLAQRAALRQHLEHIQRGDFMRREGEAWPLLHLTRAFTESDGDASWIQWLADTASTELIAPAQHLLEHIVSEVSRPSLPQTETPS